MTSDKNAILLVEDDDFDIVLMQRAFQKANLSNPLFIMKGGNEAVAYLKGLGEFSDRKKFPEPAAMLLDLKMPNMNGFEVLEWVRNDPVWKRLFVVILTSSPRTEDIDKVYELNANGFLVKPSSLKLLVETVDTFCTWLEINQISRMPLV